MHLVNPYLQKFINGAVIQGDLVLSDLLHEADDLPGCALYIPDFISLAIPYIGEEVIQLVGHSAQQFMAQGISLVFKLTNPSELPKLTAQQAMYMQMVQQPEFNLHTVLIQEYHYSLQTPSGQYTPIIGMGVILTFNELREFRVGVGFILRDDQENEALLNQCKAILIKIKDRHNSIYPHSTNHLRETPYLVQYIDQVHHTITLREREVLGYLAKGCSTKETAQALRLSEHTIESHRKNLLQKFNAKNSAELIKKASKVFWLE